MNFHQSKELTENTIQQTKLIEFMNWFVDNVFVLFLLKRGTRRFNFLKDGGI